MYIFEKWYQLTTNINVADSKFCVRLSSEFRATLNVYIDELQSPVTSVYSSKHCKKIKRAGIWSGTLLNVVVLISRHKNIPNSQLAWHYNIEAEYNHTFHKIMELTSIIPVSPCDGVTSATIWKTYQPKVAGEIIPPHPHNNILFHCRSIKFHPRYRHLIADITESREIIDSIRLSTISNEVTTRHRIAQW